MLGPCPDTMPFCHHTATVLVFPKGVLLNGGGHKWEQREVRTRLLSVVDSMCPRAFRRSTSRPGAHALWNVHLAPSELGSMRGAGGSNWLPQRFNRRTHQDRSVFEVLRFISKMHVEGLVPYTPGSWQLGCVLATPPSPAPGPSLPPGGAASPGEQAGRPGAARPPAAGPRQSRGAGCWGPAGTELPLR